MIIKINRTGEKIILDERKDKRSYSIHELLAEYGYSAINVLDYSNYNDIEWEGIEFNRLFKSVEIKIFQ